MSTANSRAYPATEGRKRRAQLDPLFASNDAIHRACDNWARLLEQGVCPRCGNNKENSANMHCDPCRMDWRRRKQPDRSYHTDLDFTNALRNSAGRWQIRSFEQA